MAENLLEEILADVAKQPEATPELLAAIRSNVEMGFMIPCVTDGVPGFVLLGNGEAALAQMRLAAAEVAGHG